MSFKREESVLMRGNRRSRLLYSSGGTYRGRTNPRRRQCILGSAAHAPSQKAAAEKLEQLGINSTQTFIEATTNITFNEQAEIWLKECANRKKRPLEQTTLDTRRYALDKWMYTFFGDKLLANIHNAAMKEFVDHIADLSPATIRDYVNVAKSVVASARDEEGKMLFPRAWDDEFIDVPFIEDQKQPTVDRHGMEAILREATEPYRTLYAFLAGCGPMRAGEALGLDIKSIHPDFRTLDIVQKAKRGKLQDYMKTKNADTKHGRIVDLPAKLAAVLRDFVGSRHSGLVFCQEDGSQISQRNILKYSLHPILKKLELEQGGLNIFRRFRIAAMETAEVPQALQHTWSGHARTHVSERYKKLLRQREWRLEWAEKIVCVRGTHLAPAKQG